MVEKLKAAKPTRATVELKLGFAVEAGKLTALWVGGKGEASLTVTLEWSEHSGSVRERRWLTGSRISCGPAPYGSLAARCRAPGSSSRRERS